MKKDKGYCYLVCSVKDDLPVAVLDSYFQLMDYMDICQATAWKMIKNGAIVKGCYVERVLL